MKKIWKKIKQFLKKLFGKKEKPETQYPLVFCYGNFPANNAVEDSEVQIKDFRMDSRYIYYSWAKNDLSRWGYAYTEASALACAFFFDEESKTWKGGKFEWISTSRLSRDMTNLLTGYGGWDCKKFLAAKKHGFCIVSKDRSRRTNLITD